MCVCVYAKAGTGALKGEWERGLAKGGGGELMLLQKKYKPTEKSVDASSSSLSASTSVFTSNPRSYPPLHTQA